MKLEVIIVSFNTAPLLKNCLQSLFDSLKKDDLGDKSQVTVVDNASRDNTLSMLRNFSKVKIIANKKNLGFAAANNQAIRKSKAEFIFLLNSDTQIRSGVLKLMINKLEKDPQAGVIGPRLINPDGSTQPSAGFFPTLPKVFFWMFFIDDLPYLSRIIRPYHARSSDYNGPVNRVDWVSGAAFLFRQNIVESTGLLDENIFMYGEEVEWCYRISRAGYRIYFLPGVKIIHVKGASSTGADNALLSEFESLIYFYRKHFPSQVLILKLALLSGALLRLILFAIIGRFPKVKLYAQIFVRVAR